MLYTPPIEELICLVSAMDRPMLIEQFGRYQATFPVDFTPEFLEGESLERLRHIFVAMCLQCRRMPEPPMDLAAGAA